MLDIKFEKYFQLHGQLGSISPGGDRERKKEREHRDKKKQDRAKGGQEQMFEWQLRFSGMKQSVCV